MKNRNLAKTRKLKNNMAIFICCRQCTPSVQENEINRFYLWAVWNEKRVDTFCTNDVIDAVLRVSVTVDCLWASFVGKSWRWVWLAHINSNLDYQGVT